jgi:hypothetical protein
VIEKSPEIGHTTILDEDLENRIIKYLYACPPAIEGQGGSIQLFKVALAITHGFALDAATSARLIIEHYNWCCQPPWTIEEIRQKVEDSAHADHDRPRGYLLHAKRNVASSQPEDTPAIIMRAFKARVNGIAARKAKGTVGRNDK